MKKRCAAILFMGMLTCIHVDAAQGTAGAMKDDNQCFMPTSQPPEALKSGKP